VGTIRILKAATMGKAAIQNTARAHTAAAPEDLTQSETVRRGKNCRSLDTAKVHTAAALRPDLIRAAADLEEVPMQTQ
jgi:hypothetical protein